MKRKIIDLSDNGLLKIPDYIFKESDLKVLIHDNNQISSVPDDIYKLIELEELSLNNNKVTRISKRISRLSKLETISIAGNSLLQIQIEIIGINSLKNLCIYDNLIEKINKRIYELNNDATYSATVRMQININSDYQKSNIMKTKAFYFILPGLFLAVMLFTNCEDEIVTPDETSGTYTDARDGRAYNWVKIGDQVWMTENLAFLTPNCWAYNNNESNVSQYGYLYTWDAAMVAAPDGWHVATDSEWKELQKFLGLSQMEADEEGWQGEEGGKLKSTTTWNENGGGTDEVGFKAVAGGYHLGGGAFDLMGTSGIWWTATEATEFSTSYAWLRQMSTNNNAIYRGKNAKEYGYSVRCVRD